ncbi:MAG TPA: glycosyltransferase [Thermoanaerobaculia bacterium]
MSQPKVSVVTIFLNAEAFLEEAVRSVRAQTLGDWELLLVDDGSTDSGAAIARRHAGELPDKIRCLEHSGHANRGMSASRNLGIAHARGEHVAFLDADDVFLPRALERRVAELEARPEAGAVYGPTLFWYGWTGDPEDARRDFVDFRGGRRLEAGALIQPPALLARFLRDGGSVPCLCSLLVQRRAIEETGGFEERFRGLYEDQAFYAKLAVSVPVLTSNEWVARYRQHPDSSCAAAERRGEALAARHAYLEWLAEYLDRQEVRDPEVIEALREELAACRHPILHRLRREPAKAAVAPLRAAARKVLPRPLRRALGGLLAPAGSRPPVGGVRLGDLRRLEPVSRAFGFDRGLPVDRHYIEGFLARHAEDVRGRVLEVGDDSYTRRFGGDRVAVRDVLHVSAESPAATIVADLSEGGADGSGIPSGAFDCAVIVQTLHLIWDTRAAMRTLRRILRPGGVLLLTVPGISPIDAGEWGSSWHWSFTPLSLRRLAEEAFPPDRVEVESHGNVLAACAFLQGLAAGELRPEELDHHDPCYPVVVTLRAIRPGGEA